MSTVTDFINKVKLKEGFKFDGQVAELLGIDRRILANWKARESLPTKYHQWYCDRYDIELKDFRQEIKLTNTDIQLKETSNMDAQYVIDLQKDKIQQQEKELVMLKNILEQQPLQKMKFDDVQADFQSSVEMRNIFSLKPMERKIYNVEGVENLAKKLNISPDIIRNSYFSEGNWHITEQHPVDEIIDKKSLKELKQMTRNLPTVLDSLKWVAGLHYMVTPVKYVIGKHYCNTICYILLDWKSKPVKVLSKSVIINGVS
jgi:hypothetical protein|tara:strand:- start:26 stop:802 length:777 start_codon:yes stop_codon:yes gene_type:complete